ncbi:hypothetical protein F4678DRAFT_185663 [Xylaria arbuscula]|nr:hypothetical protein F4678DRAFT_185663 [Xylaria arbuscula]
MMGHDNVGYGRLESGSIFPLDFFASRPGQSQYMNFEYTYHNQMGTLPLKLSPAAYQEDSYTYNSFPSWMRLEDNPTIFFEKDPSVVPSEADQMLTYQSGQGHSPTMRRVQRQHHLINRGNVIATTMVERVQEKSEPTFTLGLHLCAHEDCIGTKKPFKLQEQLKRHKNIVHNEKAKVQCPKGFNRDDN